MRKLCPNFDREDGLDTILEVPIPEEMITSANSGGSSAGGGGGGEKNAARFQNMSAWLKAQAFDKASEKPVPQSGRNTELQLLLNVVGSPLIPCPVPHDRAFSRSIRDSSIQASTAKYIIQQYIAATGGQAALTSVNSMYAIGKVKMTTSEFHVGEEAPAKGSAEVGGYVLLQKHPDLWYFELIMGGFKSSAGSDGKLAWHQSASEHSHVSRGTTRPLRRTLQGLDPRSTASLFSDAVCIGEKIIKDEECFILKLDANAATLRSRSCSTVEFIHHTLWGYFSQRTGLLIQLADTRLVRIKSPRRAGESIFWETSMESVIQDYRHINGVNIAHGGRTGVTLFRYGEGSLNHKRKMEEVWTVEEVDFNLWGLSTECFLPPAGLKLDDEEAQHEG